MNEQKSEEWFQDRLGKVTASRVADVMARTKSGYGAARKSYMSQLLCERLTGNREDSFQNAAMQRGTDLEPIARSAYEMDKGVMVSEVGFVDHPEIPNCGASPDGMVNEDGLVEIKCPNTATHIDFLKTGRIERKYQLQMMLQLACTGRSYCDFVSFDDRLPEELSYKCVRFEPHPDEMDDMLKEIKKFLAELNVMVSDLKEMMVAA